MASAREILGVSVGANQHELKMARKRLLQGKKLHPDLGGELGLCQRINEACSSFPSSLLSIAWRGPLRRSYSGAAAAPPPAAVRSDSRH